MYCNINVIPTELALLTKLKDLDTSHNPLNNIPNLQYLINLKCLYMDKNNIKYIPNEIYKLNKLECII